MKTKNPQPESPPADSPMKGLEALLSEEEGVTPTPKPTPETPPQPAPEPETPPQPEQTPSPEPEPEPTPEPETDQDDDDLDRPPPGVDARARETAAQRRAAENGRKLKALETEHQEAKLELDRLRSELELAKKSTSGQQQVNPGDFAKHETVQPLINEVTAERDALAKVQEYPEVGRIVRSKFGAYMEKFIEAEAADAATGQAAETELRREIVEDFKEAFKKANPDWDDADEMNREARSFLASMLQALVKNAGKTQEITNRISNLAAKAREGQLAQGVEVYTHHETDLRKSITGVMEIPQAAIDDNPHTVEATVANLVQQPEWKKRYDNITNEVLQLMLGPKPLTQAELDGMSKGGLSVKDFTRNREKAFLEKRRKLAAQIAQALLIRGLWEQTSRDAAEFNEGKEVLDAINRSKPADPSPPPAPASKRKPGDAIEEYLTSEGYRA